MKSRGRHETGHAAEAPGAHLLGLRQVLPGRRPGVRERHHPGAASLRALRRRLAGVVNRARREEGGRQGGHTMNGPSTSSLPPRLLPLLYFAPAHASLALACPAVAIDPHGFAGFYYHARMVAVVHLVTLGWITASILGALYLVAPIAFRTTLPARWPDYAAAALVWIGIIGMVAHFWIAEFRGMAWSGATVAAAVLWVGARVIPPLWRARVPGAVRRH